MSSLYKLTDTFQKINEMSPDDEVFQDTLDSINWKENFNDKVVNYLHVIDNIKAEINENKTEAKRQQELAKTKENKVNKMRDALLNAMNETGTNKVKTFDHSVSVHDRAKLEITDMDKLPKQFFVKQPDKLSKKDLNTYYKYGHDDIPGTNVVTYPSITIR